MTRNGASQPFRLPDHEVIHRSGDWAFHCPGWHMWWGYRDKKTADYFLSAHLLYPVAPCPGPPQNAPDQATS